MSTKPFAVPAELRNAVQDQSIPEATALQALAVVSGAVRTYCRWDLSAGYVEDLKVRAATGKSLWLPTLHLRSVVALSRDGVALSVPLDYDWEEEGRILLASRTWSRTTYLVSYHHGYLDTDPRLQSIKGVVLAAAGRYVDNVLGRRSEQAGAETIVSAGSGDDVTSILTKGERSQLAPVQLPVLG